MTKINKDEQDAIQRYLDGGGKVTRKERRERTTIDLPLQPGGDRPDRMYNPPKARPPAKTRESLLRLQPQMTVQRALEWAFATECVQLELPDRRPAEERGFGFGMEHVLLERAKLGGVRIDTSFGVSEPHEDAETIAAITAGLPDHLGGLRMATRVAELARARREPDWMRDAAPRYEPREWRLVAGRWEGKAEVVGQISVPVGRRLRRRDVRACPVVLTPHPDQIKGARDAYRKWWAALHQIRNGLQTCGMLRQVQIMDQLPPLSPWAR